MFDLIFLVLSIFIGGHMIFFPEEILERPACKIKSKRMIRVWGVLFIVARVLLAIA